MNTLARNKVRRRALQKHCKKLETEITELIESFKHERLLDLKALKHNYQDQIDQLAVVNDDIIQSIEDEELLETEISNSLSDKDSFYTTLSKIDHCLGNVRLLPSVPTAEGAAPSSTAPLLNTRAIKSNTTDLPKIILERFDGNILNWAKFWKQFEACVHMQSHFSVLSKVTFLKGLLAPSARECLEGLPLTSDNYNKAIQKLRAKYENTEKLIYAHMDAFAKLPRVKSSKRIEKLREIMEKLENIVNHLASLKVETEVYGSFLIPMLLKKLPKDLVVIISRKVNHKKWDLANVLAIYREEIEAIERCSYCKDNTVCPQNSTDERDEKKSEINPKVSEDRKKPEKIIKKEDDEKLGNEMTVRKRANDVASAIETDSEQRKLSFAEYVSIQKEKELSLQKEKDLRRETVAERRKIDERLDTEKKQTESATLVQNRENPQRQTEKDEMDLSFAQIVSRQEEQLDGMQFIFKITCPFCHSVRHPAAECYHVPDVPSRMDVLRQRGRCFVCLKTGHEGKDCASDGRCSKCNDRHHLSICDKDTTLCDNDTTMCDNSTVDASEEECLDELKGILKGGAVNEKNVSVERGPSFFGSTEDDDLKKFRRQTSCPL